jgi:ComF family protein
VTLLRLVDGLLQIVAPRTCVACHGLLSGRSAEEPGLGICGRCAPQVTWIGSGACRGCARPRQPFEAERGTRCARCLREPMGVRSTVALLKYAGPGRHVLRAVKYYGRHDLVPALGSGLADQVAAAHPELVGADRVALVTAVPQHWTRRLIRGKNHAERIGMAVARELGLPYVGGALRRARRTQALFRVAHQERARELAGAIVAAREVVRGRWVLVVDDIRTTGSTLAACGEALREAGAAMVDAAVVGR